MSRSSGAGPAGSTAAVLLARAGWNVTLVEQSRFPRDKVCGECLSALGYEVLTRLGLADAFRQLGAVRLDRAEIHPRRSASLLVELPQPMWGLSRFAFDALLVNAARDAGVIVRQPARCENVSAHCIRLRDLATNEVDSLRPSHVLLADGKASFASDLTAPTGDFGVKTHFENVDGPCDAIELFAVRGSYGGLAAIERDQWNFAFSVPADCLKDCRGDLDALCKKFVSENETLAKRLKAARRVGRWLASPLPRYSVRTNWQNNVIPVGNAAAALEPIGGEGMGLAMRSAELAVESMIEASSVDELQSEYGRLWNPRRFGCRATAIAVSQSVLSRALLRPAVPQFAVRGALKLLGK